MQRILKIKGMNSKDCSKKVEDSLNVINGISAKVDFEKQEATVTMKREVTDALLTQMVNEAGCDVVSVK